MSHAITVEPDACEYSVDSRAPDFCSLWRRIFHVVVALALSSVVLVTHSEAQEVFPTKPVTLIIPFGPGTADIALRSIAASMERKLGKPVIPDNKPGGGGSLGPAVMAATAKPDGYTISLIPDAVFRVQLMQKTAYDAQRDFTYIMAHSSYAFGVITPADSPFHSWNDVVTYAKNHPGKVTYASNGVGGSLHIGMERIARAAGIQLTHVPFKSSGEVNAAVTGSHVMLGTSGLSAKPLADAGKVRYLQVWTKERVASLPNVPTLRELGFSFDIRAPLGFAGPRGMDPKVVEKLHDALRHTLDDTQVREMMNKLELVPFYLSGPDYKKASAESMEAEKVVLGELGLLRK